jgi:hypothetical protein
MTEKMSGIFTARHFTMSSPEKKGEAIHCEAPENNTDS